MKNLTKKKLDELAKEMQVVCKEEIESMFGRAYYYDLNGNFIGICGDSSEIRIIDSSIYVGSIGGSIGGVSGDGEWGNNLIGSIPFQSASTQQRADVIRSIAIQAGLSGVTLNVEDLEAYKRFGEYRYSTDIIVINSNSALFEFGN